MYVREQIRHWPLVTKLLVVCALMFAFGYAMVPIYRVVCEITGLNGYLDAGPREAAAAVDRVDTSRKVTVQFVGQINGNGPWEFRPTERSMEVHPGEIYTTTYYAANKTGDARAGQASYNMTPGTAARYFAKPDCFCFTRQDFAAEEGRKMPVTFFIDPDLPEEVKTVTLSYTLFDLGADS